MKTSTPGIKLIGLMCFLFLLFSNVSIAQNLGGDKYEYTGSLDSRGKISIARTSCIPVQNPAFDPSCSYKVILILDESGSIDGAGTGASDIESDVETAVTGFVNALINDCLDIDLAIIEFGTDARRAVIDGSTGFQKLDADYPADLAAYLSPSGVGDDSASSYAPDSSPNQNSFYTNWDAALYEADELAGNQEVFFVLFTDGNPTAFGINDINETVTIDTSGDNQNLYDQPCEQANIIKTKGNRIFTVGLPNSSLVEDNVRVLHNGANSLKYSTTPSGPLETDDIRLADYLITSEENVGDAFAALAAAINKPTITSDIQSADLGCNPETIPTPVFTVIDDCNQSPPANVVEGSIIIDGCSRSKKWTANYSNSCFDADEVVVEFTWTVDDENPTFDCPQEAIDLGGNPDQNEIPSEASVKALVENGSNELGIAAASDDCGIKSIVVTADPIQTVNCVSTQVFDVLITDNCDKTKECSITYTWTEELPDITINPVDPLCEDSDAVTLTATPPGGSFSGQGVNGSSFNPSGLSGDISITYTFTDNVTGCTNSDSIDIQVNPLPEVSITDVDPVCIDASAFQLQASPDGGVWSGDVDANGNFDPANGSGSATYTYTDQNGCTNSDSIDIQVNPLPEVSITDVDPVCIDASAFQLQASPDGGVWSGDVDANGNFDPANGSGSATYTYTDQNGCTNSDSIDIQVNPLPEVSITDVDPVCIDASAFQLQASPDGGVWSGDVDANGNFDPANGSGSATYTYTDQNGCTNSDSIDIQVNPLPEVSITDVDPVCIDASAFQLQASPDGGVWSGDVDANGNFDPANGSGSATYTYTDQNGCTNSDSIDIQVNPLPEVSITDVDPVCIDASAFQLQASPDGGTWSGDVDANGNFDPANGSGSATYTYTDQNGCTNSDSIDIQVNPLPEVSITDVDPVCIDASAFQLQASPDGGVWSGDVDANGNFDPANGSGSATYTYTDQNGCTNSDSIDIQVNPLPEVSITDVDPVCIDASAFQLQASPDGGVWSGDVDANGNFDPANGSGSATYTYTDQNGCTNSDSIDIQVNPLPEVSITDVDPVCIDASAFQLQASPDGGVWSGDVDANGNFDPANGSGSATYTYTDQNGCTNSDSIDIQVNPLPEVSITDVDPVCIDASAFQLQASPDGGVWSGDVDANGNFDPANGSGSATYTYTDQNGCTNSDSIDIQVNPLPEVSITDVDPVCIDASAFQLQASPDGGVWSGDVDVNGNFDPANGSGSATYTYTDQNGCTNSDSIDIQVNPLPTITPQTPVCSEDLLTYSVTFSSNGTVTVKENIQGIVVTNNSVSGIPAGQNITLVATSADQCTAEAVITAPDCSCPVVQVPQASDQAQCDSGQTLTATATAGNGEVIDWFDDQDNPVQDPSLTGVGMVTYFAQARNTTTNCTSAKVPVKLEIYDLPEVSITDVDPVCIDASAFQLQASPDGGVWSGDVDANGNFDPANGSGSATYTYTDQNGCTNSDSIDIQVNPLPEVSITDVDPVCIDASAFQLQASPDGGVWSGDVDANGNFDPANGSGSATYTYTDQNGCTNSDSIDIQVNPLPEVSITDVDPVCIDASAFQLQASPDGGVWSGDVDANGNFDPANGSGSATYTYTDQNGCTNSDSIDIQVNPLPEVSITDVDPVCIDASAFQLQASPDGGVWSGDVDANGNFDPANGSGSATYTYTDQNGCTNSDSIDIQVNPLPEVSITDVDPVCIDASAFQLQASPDGGVWSGDVDANGNFDPANGSGSATYTYTDQNGCTNSDSIDIQVNPLPTITPQTPVCSDDLLTYSVTVTVSGGTVKSSEDASVTDNGNNSWTISGIAANTNTTLTVTNDNECSASIEITAPDCSCPVVETPQASDQAECDSGQTLTASATPGDGEVIDWFDDQDNPVQDPSLTGVGMVTYFAQARNTTTNCTSAKVPVKLEIYDLPEVSITDVDPVCIDASAFQLQASPDGGVWSGDVDANGNFDPANDSGSATYTYTDQNGCTNSDSIDIQVNPLPEVSITDVDPVCIDASAFQLQASPDGGTWSGDVDANGNFDPANGSGSATYTYTDQNGCTNSASIDIQVNPLPFIEILDKVCDEDALTYSVFFDSNSDVESTVGDVDNENGIVSNIPSGESVTLTAISENGCETQKTEEAEVCTDVQINVDSLCFEDGAYLEYDVTLTGLPDVTSFTVSWKDNEGQIVKEDDVPLVDGMASGWLPWPGIEFDENDVVIDWPGYILQDGVWIIADDGFEDLRPTADIEISFNSGNGGRFMGPNASLNEEDGVMPQEFKVTYPPGTPQCNPNPPEEDPCVLYGDIAEDVYKVFDHTREQENYKHSIWVNGFPCQGAQANFSFDDGMYKGFAYTLKSNGNFVITGTAYLSGIKNNNCDKDYLNSVWSVDFEFRPATPEDGIVPKSENGFDDTGFPEDPIWDYYVIVRGSMGKVGDPEGAPMPLPETTINFFDMASNDFGLQVGEGGNVKNPGLGASTWLDYEVIMGEDSYLGGNKHADINVNLHEIICEDPPLEEPICEEYSAFYAHNGAGNASSIIYGVEFSGGDAIFTELIDMSQYGQNYRVHISYDEAVNVLYAARNDGSELISFTYNPVSMKWVELNRALLDGLPGGIVQNVFFDGLVYLGSSSTNDIYSVNPLTKAVVHYDFTNLSINGGDLVVKDGRMFSATRSGRKIYRLDFNTLTGSVINNNQGTPAKVNGVAVSIGGNVLMTNDGKEEVFILNNDGADIGSYTVVGNPFPDSGNKLLDGDLASGCSDGGGEEPNEPCDNNKVFYVDHNGGDSSLYRVALDENALTADFSFITTLPYQAHITLNTDDGYVYAVDEDDNKIYKINPNDGATEDMITLNPTDGSSINSIYCMAYYQNKIYLGSAQKDMIYEVELNGDYSVIASDVPVQGGDLIYRNNRLYLATRAENKLYFIAGGPNSEIEVGSIATKVNGLALNASDEFITSNFGHNKIYRYSGTGAALDPYMNIGALEVFSNGDLASGCTDADPEPAGCENYVAYGTNFSSDEETVIYSIEFDGDLSSATTTEIATRRYKAHLTFNPDDGYIYAVNEDASAIEKISPIDGTGVLIDLVKSDGLQPNLNKVINMVYYDGKIYLGDQNKDVVLEVEFIGGDAVYSVYAENVPVQGGDLVWREDVLYLATRSNNSILEIDTSGVVDTVTNQLQNKVTGLGLAENDNFIVTNDGQTAIYEYDIDGNEVAVYQLSGDVTDLFSGDLASGCADNGGGDSLCDIAEIGNPGAEIPATGDRFNQYGPGELPAAGGVWDTTTSIEIQKSGEVDGNLSFCGDYHFELLSRAEGDNMYQVIDTDPGALVYVSFYHKKRRDNGITNVMKVLAGDLADFDTDDHDNDYQLDQLGGLVTRQYLDGWVYVTRSFRATSNQTVVMLRGLEGSTVSVGNLIDDVFIGCYLPDERPSCNTTVSPLIPHTGAYSDFIIDASRVNLYPVPAEVDLSIKVDNSGHDVRGTYYIASINGRTGIRGEIKITNGESNVVKENVSTLPDGMYFLILELNGRTISKQFMKTSR